MSNLAPTSSHTLAHTHTHPPTYGYSFSTGVAVLVKVVFVRQERVTSKENLRHSDLEGSGGEGGGRGDRDGEHM